MRRDQVNRMPAISLAVYLCGHGLLGGCIQNEKLARSQIIGGTVGGIGMALLEETRSTSSSSASRIP